MDFTRLPLRAPRTEPAVSAAGDVFEQEADRISE